MSAADELLPTLVVNMNCDGRDLHDAQLSGTLPTLSGCDRLISLDATNNSFTGLPTSLPPGLSHIYLERNPMRGEAADLGAALRGVRTLAALDVSLLNIGLTIGCGTAARDPGSCKDLDGRTLSDMTRVVPPQSCRVGGENCAFTLRLYDSVQQPVRMGGLVSGLELGNASGTAGSAAGGRVRMVDNRDGTFTGTVKASWVTSKGPHTFSFWLNGIDISREIHIDAKGRGVDGVSLRTVDFAPRTCAGSHTVADAATGGAICKCLPGFEADTGPNASTTVLSCHRKCEGGRVVMADGSSCVCIAGTYDAETSGEVSCVASEWHSGASSGARSCLPCPSECATCKNGAMILKEGWRLNGSTAAQVQSLIEQ
eukprot:COSAG01_NODE_16547_length_1227_cov_1.335106_1_plen_369_part_01